MVSWVWVVIHEDIRLLHHTHHLMSLFISQSSPNCKSSSFIHISILFYNIHDTIFIYILSGPTNSLRIVKIYWTRVPNTTTPFPTPCHTLFVGPLHPLISPHIFLFSPLRILTLSVCHSSSVHCPYTSQLTFLLWTTPFLTTPRLDVSSLPTGTLSYSSNLHLLPPPPILLTITRLNLLSP